MAFLGKGSVFFLSLFSANLIQQSCYHGYSLPFPYHVAPKEYLSLPERFLFSQKLCLPMVTISGPLRFTSPFLWIPHRKCSDVLDLILTLSMSALHGRGFFFQTKLWWLFFVLCVHSSLLYRHFWQLRNQLMNTLCWSRGFISPLTCKLKRVSIKGFYVPVVL